MIHLKTPLEIEKMKKAGKVVGDLLKFLEERRYVARLTTKSCTGYRPTDLSRKDKSSV